MAQSYTGQAPDWALFQRDPAAYAAWQANQAAVANAVADSQRAQDLFALQDANPGAVFTGGADGRGAIQAPTGETRSLESFRISPTPPPVNVSVGQPAAPQQPPPTGDPMQRGGPALRYQPPPGYPQMPGYPGGGGYPARPAYGYERGYGYGGQYGTPYNGYGSGAGAGAYQDAFNRYAAPGGYGGGYPRMPGYPGDSFGGRGGYGQVSPDVYWKDPGFSSGYPQAPGYPRMPRDPGGMSNWMSQYNDGMRQQGGPYMAYQGGGVGNRGPTNMGGPAAEGEMRNGISDPGFNPQAAQQEKMRLMGGQAGAPGSMGYGDRGPTNMGSPAAQAPKRPTVPLAHQVNPMVWDSLGPVGRELAYGAIGQTGQDPGQYEYDLNQARPRGSSLGGGAVRYASSRGFRGF